MAITIGHSRLLTVGLILDEARKEEKNYACRVITLLQGCHTIRVKAAPEGKKLAGPASSILPYAAVPLMAVGARNTKSEKGRSRDDLHLLGNVVSGWPQATVSGRKGGVSGDGRRRLRATSQKENLANTRWCAAVYSRWTHPAV